MPYGLKNVGVTYQRPVKKHNITPKIQQFSTRFPLFITTLPKTKTQLLPRYTTRTKYKLSHPKIPQNSHKQRYPTNIH